MNEADLFHAPGANCSSDSTCSSSTTSEEERSVPASLLFTCSTWELPRLYLLGDISSRPPAECNPSRRNTPRRRRCCRRPCRTASTLRSCTSIRAFLPRRHRGVTWLLLRRDPEQHPPSSTTGAATKAGERSAGKLHELLLSVPEKHADL